MFDLGFEEPYAEKVKKKQQRFNQKIENKLRSIIDMIQDNPDRNKRNSNLKKCAEFINSKIK